MLLKPQLEREAACISIWHRLVTTMVENVCNPQTTYEAENEGRIYFKFRLIIIYIYFFFEAVKYFNLINWFIVVYLFMYLLFQ